MFGARNFFLTAARAVGDSLWNYVTALFSTTSTNGAQNNTFLDSSTNNFTITRNGNTTQGSFSPYEPNGYWSNFFGSGQYLSLSDGTQFNLSGGTYTIECWINPTGNYSNYNTILAKRSGDSAGTFGWELFLFTGTGNLCFASNYGTAINTGITPPAGVWSHVAAVYDGTNISVYLNGTRLAQGATGNTNVSAPIYVGSYPTYSEQFLGYISNMRITKGAMLYTGASFTVPTTPLTTSVSGGTVSLLTCQSNRFIDNSSNAATITVNGSPSVQAFSPLGNSTPYSTAAVGGSGYFDGSGDYLSVAAQTALGMGAGDFTYEAWIYVNEIVPTNAIRGLFDSRVSGATGCGIYTSADSGTTSRLVYATNSAIVASSSITITPYTWTHIAVTRSSGTVRGFINGTLQFTVTDSRTFSSSAGTYIAADVSLSCFNGYINDARILKGTAQYTAAFTPPTAPLTAITNTSLLLSYTNAGIFDSAAANDFETVGNAQVSTTQAKFGPTSMYFDGTSAARLTAPSSVNYDFGTGNFTVEFWLYLNSVPSVGYIVMNGTGIDASPLATCGWAIIYNSGNLQLQRYDGGTQTAYSFAWTPATSTWYHVAVVRYGTTLQAFVNGQQIGATQSSSISFNRINTTAPLTVGNGQAGGGASYPINGYIDDLRITKGYARYWYNFPVPTAAFQVQYAPEVPTPNDPLFDYVTMLLPGNGTNGAQNNTFLDSSANNYTITRNGNSTQGAFTPYGPNWSNYLDGDGDNLTLADNAAFEFGNGSFSIDIWINPFAMKGYQGILGKTDSGGDQRGWILYFETSNIIYFQYGNGSWVLGNNSFGTVPVNNWTHLAVTRDTSNVWRFFKNGILVNSTTNSGTINDSNSLLYIGKWPFFPGYSNAQDFGGYMSNVRIVKGGMPTLFNTAVTAIGTQVFTPPTAPYTGAEALTAGSVSLLTCQSNRFIDNSANNFTITRNGDVSVQRFSPFNPPASYSAATIGGSGYFDGTGDFLQVADAAAMELGSGNWTIELWVNTLTNTQYSALWTRDDGGVTAGSYVMLLNTTSANGIVTFWAADINGFSAPVLSSGSVSCRDGAWHHIAVVRNSNTLTMYVDGVSTSTASYSGAFANTAQPIKIGSETGYSRDYTGYMADVRLVVGTAVYTSNFTPPTAPLTAVTNTSLLLNFTNGGIIDNAMMNDLETVGNAQISTSVSKFGGGSMYFDGTTSNRIRPPASVNYAFGTGNFTVEAWVYVTNLTTENFVFDTRSSVSTAGMGFSLEPNTGKLRYSGNANNVLTSTGVSANTWTHVAWVRNNGTLTGYINGVSGGSASNSDNLTQTNGEVGNVPFSAVGTNMYIDDFRITKGIARYVQNFTPPTQAFQTQ